MKKVVPDQERVWKRHGIQGYGQEPPFLYDMYSGTCVIVGSGRSVWSDLEAYPPYQYGPMAKPYSPGPQFDVMAINDMGLYLPHIDHWVSIHDDVLLLFHEARKKMGGTESTLHGNTPVSTVSHCVCCGGIMYWHLAVALGCSGLLAVHIALLLGYDEIVLAGVPADNEGNFYHPPGLRGTHGVNKAKERWGNACQRTPEIPQKVRSLSGFTRDLLGAPAVILEQQGDTPWHTPQPMLQ